MKDHSISRCRRCGAGLYRPNPFSDQCAHCMHSDLRFDQTLAVGNYQGLLKELVVRMKNQHDDVLAYHLGHRMAYELIGHGWTDVDSVLPVPSHWLRRLNRGFQASEILADQVSRLLQIPLNTHALYVARPTKKQGMLSETARRKNVRNAFGLRKGSSVKGKSILIIDDVATSGATLSEIARLLKSNGASQVRVAVVARGVGRGGIPGR